MESRWWVIAYRVAVMAFVLWAPAALIAWATGSGPFAP